MNRKGSVGDGRLHILGVGKPKSEFQVDDWQITCPAKGVPVGICVFRARDKLSQSSNFRKSVPNGWLTFRGRSLGVRHAED